MGVVSEHGTELVPATQPGTLPPERVRDMFDRIARPYDTMNRVMTAGPRPPLAARSPRRRPASAPARACSTSAAAPATSRSSSRAASGTAARSSASTSRRACSSAPASKLDRAGFARVRLLEADALALPLPDDRVAAATVAFGVRNLADLDRGFRELERVVRPGGRIACLEITTPESRRPRRLLPRLVRPVGADRRPRRRPPRRLRVLLPAGLRAALPAARRARPRDAAGRPARASATRCWPAASSPSTSGRCRCDRARGRPPRRRRGADLHGAHRDPPRRRLALGRRHDGADGRRDARGGRQAPAAPPRLPRRAGRRPQPRRTWCAPQQPSSSCTWRPSCTTTCSTALRCAAASRRSGRRTATRSPPPPVTTCSPAPSASWLRRATCRPSTCSRAARSASPRARRCSGSRPGGPRPRPRSTWSAARSRPAGCSPRPARSVHGSAAWTTPTSTSSPPTAAASAWPSRSPTTCSTASGSPESTGKPIGTDLLAGIATLPLLLAARHDDVVRAALSTPPAPGDVLPVLARVATSGALAEARETAIDFVRLAEFALDRVGGDLDTRPLRAVVRSSSTATPDTLPPGDLPASWPPPSPPTSSSRSARR